MTVRKLLQNRTPNPDFEGFVTNDDWVLAIDISQKSDSADGDYVVVDMGITGLDAQLKSVSQDKHYIRAGQSTTKTGTQRTFKVSGDRYIGDPFQDFVFSHRVKYGVGQAVIVPYTYFCVLNGKGEKGTASIIINSDASGTAGETSGIELDIRKVGAEPVEYVYTGA